MKKTLIALALVLTGCGNAVNPNGNYGSSNPTNTQQAQYSQLSVTCVNRSLTDIVSVTITTPQGIQARNVIIFPNTLAVIDVGFDPDWVRVDTSTGNTITLILGTDYNIGSAHVGVWVN